jgi:hypothetical protein
MKRLLWLALVGLVLKQANADGVRRGVLAA